MFKMRFCWVSVFFVMLSMMLFGCSDGKDDSILANQKIKDAFIDVLQSKVEILTGYGEYYFLKDLTADTFPVKIVKFTIIDMEGDGMPEIILEISVPPEDRIVLHYYDGIVYGYDFSVRSMSGLWKNGTFIWGGIRHNGLSRLQFTNGMCEIKDIASQKVHTDSDGEVYVTFYIGDKEVYEEEYNAFRNEQFAGHAEWYEFNEETIAEDFIIAWEKLN